MIRILTVKGRDLNKLIPACIKQCRNLSHELLYREYGEPEAVLRLENCSYPNDISSDDVEVDWLAAPVNPSDINQIQGKYGIKPQLPAVPGNEGVGIVRSVGRQVQALRAGDRVVPVSPGLGTWREAGRHKEAALHKISNRLPLGVAATLLVNPPSAIRLLEDMVHLKEGDVVVQNGANSIVGQLVIQIAAKRGICTVNVVRERPELLELVKQLHELGANVVTTESALREDLKSAGLPKPALALNSVGGRSSAAIASTLRPKGVIVTFGGMSMKPVSIPTGLFIFKDIQAKGFWLSGGSRNSEQAAADIDRASSLYLEDGIKTGFDFHDLSRHMEAITAPRESLLARKQLLVTVQGRKVLAEE